MKHLRLIISFKLCFLVIAALQAQLNVDNTSMTPQQLVQNVLVGSGVTISNVQYSGHIPNSIGHFTTGSNPTNLGLTSGIILSTGDVLDAPGPNTSTGMTTVNNTGGDPDLAMLVTSTLCDAAVLSFDFIPLSDTIRFRYVFASEEYPEYVNSSFNDVFGFFLSGPGITGPFTNNAINIALIPGTTMPVTINNVNHLLNTSYYVNNNFQNDPTTTIEYDGFTVVLTAEAVVTPCVPYHIKIAIADAGDCSLDSAVFLEEASFATSAMSIQQSYTIPNDTIAYRGCSNATITFNLPEPVTTSTDICYEILGSAVNGVDYQLIDSCVTIPQGQHSAQLVIEPIDLGVPGGIETVLIVAETNPCEDDTLVIYIRDYPPMSLDIPYDTICEGDNTTLYSYISGGVGPFSYEWGDGEQTTSIQVAPPLPGEYTYTLTVTDACTPHVRNITDSTKLIVHQVPTSDFALSSDSICHHDLLTLTYTGNASPQANYNWGLSGGIIESGSGQGPLDVRWNTPSLYSLSLQVEENGCVSTDTYRTVTVLPSPQITISADKRQGCVPLMVNFTDNSSNVDTWQWTFDGGNPGSDNTGNPPTITYNNPGTYDVSLNVVNEHGCTGSQVFTNYISAHPMPTANFDFKPTVGTPGLPIEFNSQLSSHFVTGWLWDFGDGTYGFEQHPSHAYNSTGTFVITLTVETGQGCKDSISKEILIIDIVIPNVFTPNGDGINDYFVIDGLENVPNSHLVVFNRWGKKVYESHNYQNNWGGEGLSDGVYFYVFTLPQGIADPINGTVTILR